jgi:hypothetical protein
VTQEQREIYDTIIERARQLVAADPALRGVGSGRLLRVQLHNEFTDRKQRRVLRAMSNATLGQLVGASQRQTSGMHELPVGIVEPVPDTPPPTVLTNPGTTVLHLPQPARPAIVRMPLPPPQPPAPPPTEQSLTRAALDRVFWLREHGFITKAEGRDIIARAMDCDDDDDDSPSNGRSEVHS